MFGSKNIYIGLDVGSFSVKAVAIAPNKGRMTLVGYAQQRIGEEDVSTIIRQVIDQLNTKTNQVVSSVSGRSVIVRQVETPRLSDSELRSHITHDADKYIPFDISEVVIDFHQLPDDEGDEHNANIQVQLVAVRKGFIEDHVGMLNSAGIYPKAIDVDLFALANAYEVFGPTQDSAMEPPVVALVDIGASKVCAVIMKGNKPLFTREFYLAGNEITDAIARQFAESPEDIEDLKVNPGESLQQLIDAAMPALEDLANEIRLSFDYVEGQFDEKVQHVILSGGSSQLNSIGDILGNILGRSVTVFDGLSGLDLDPKSYDILALESNAPSLTVALGLAVHLINDTPKGLGGLQLNNWNVNGSTSQAFTPMAQEDNSTYNKPSESETFIPPAPTIAPPPMPEPATVIATDPDQFNMAEMLPPPRIEKPAAALDMPQAPAPVTPIMDIPIAEPSGAARVIHADVDENDDDEPEDYRYQSSMLVILDDDDHSGSSPEITAPPVFTVDEPDTAKKDDSAGDIQLPPM